MNIDPNVAQRQADFIEELEDRLAALKLEQSTAAAEPEKEREAFVRMTFDLSKDLHRQFRTVCFSKDASMTDVLRAFIAQYVDENSKASR